MQAYNSLPPLETYSYFVPSPEAQKDECPVCYKELRSEEIVAHSNGGDKHPVHKACIEEWLQSIQSTYRCPHCDTICDTIIDTGLKDKIFRILKDAPLPAEFAAIAGGLLVGSMMLPVILLIGIDQISASPRKASYTITTTMDDVYVIQVITSGIATVFFVISVLYLDEKSRLAAVRLAA